MKPVFLSLLVPVGGGSRVFVSRLVWFLIIVFITGKYKCIFTTSKYILIILFLFNEASVPVVIGSRWWWFSSFR